MARFSEIPDVSFIGNITLADLKKTAVDEYKSAYSIQTNLPYANQKKPYSLSFHLILSV